MRLIKKIRKIPHKLNYELNKKLHFLFEITIGKHYLKKPLQDVIILESHTDFDTNGGALYNFMVDQGYNKKVKIVWLLWNKLDRSLPENVEAYGIEKPSLKKEIYLYTAKIISTDHLVYEKKRDDQKTFYLSHGAISLKKPQGYIGIPQNITNYLVASEYMRAITSDIYGFHSPNSKELILGYPVHDCLYKPSTDEIKKITSKRYTKVVLWMPTFRQIKGRNDSTEKDVLGIPLLKSDEEYKMLDEFLYKENMLLIIKIHPKQLLETLKITDTNNIRIITSNIQKNKQINTYELLKDSDALISDYSSIAFDYLHLDRPIGFAVSDIGSYKLGFIVNNPVELMGGPAINDYNEFTNFLKNVANGVDEYREKRQLIFDKLFKYKDGNSSARMIKYWDLNK